MEKRLYLVEDGKAYETEPVEVDGMESVLVFAYGEEDALRVAGLYDDGMIGRDNHVIYGENVVCVAENE